MREGRRSIDLPTFRPHPGRCHKQLEDARFDARPPRADMNAMLELKSRRSAVGSLPGTAVQRVALFGVSHGTTMPCMSVSAQGPTESPTDRAKCDADKVYELIRMHADQPREASTAAAGSVSAAPLPAPSVVQQPVNRGVGKLVATSVLPEATETARLVATSDVELSGRAPTVAVEALAVPLIAADLSHATVSTPSPGAKDRSSSAAAAEVPGAALVLVSGAPPDFPRHLVRRLGQGSVVVSFVVRPDGSVGAACIQKSRHAGLNEAALAAVAAWRFKPVSATTACVTELRFE